MRRIFAIVLIVLGLGTIGAAIASGTIWRPDDRVTLTLPETPDVPVVITAPGVLDAVDNQVAVRLVGASAETPIVLAMARENDARAWIGEAAHWEITGLTDWETLSYTDSRDDAPTADPTTDPSATEEPSASGEPTEDPSASAEGTEAPSEEPDPDATVPNPSGSDLWVEQLTGTGELEYSWTAVPGRWVMLVASDGTQPAPAVELTWDRPVETPFVRPGIILGSVVLLLGLGLLLLQILADLEKRRGRREAAATAASGEIAPVVVADGDRPLTRREIRLAEEARRRGRPARDTATERPAEPEVGAEAEAEATETIPAVSAEEASPGEEGSPAGAASEPTPAAPSDDAGELDAWVRSGAASPLLHEGERTTPADLDVPEDEPHGEVERADVVETPPEAVPEQPSWWRRRSRRDTPEAPAAPSTAPEPEAAAPQPEREPVPEAAEQAPAEPELQPSGETDEIPAVGNDEPDAQEWGASWRQTWGLSSGENADEPKEGDR